MAEKRSLKWLAGLALAYKTRISLILALQTGIAGLMSIQPLFFQKILGLALGEMGPGVLTRGLKYLGMLFLIFLSLALFQGLYGYLAAIFSSDLLNQLQHEFFKKFSCLPLSYFRHRSAGEFMTRLNMDIGQTQALVSATLPHILREALTIFLAMAILTVSCSALLMVCALGVVCTTSWLMFRLNRMLRVFAREQRGAWSGINKIFDETLQGIDTIKTFSGEDRVRHHFNDQTTALRKIMIKSGTTTAVFSPLIELISRFGGLSLILLAFYLVFRGHFAQKEFLLFFFYAGLFQNSVSSLIQSFSNIQSQVVSAGQLSSFLAEHDEEDPHRADRTTLPDQPLAIRIKNLTFSYPESRTLFKKFNLDAPARGITLVKGPSGSGKSTLINLILGFYPMETGDIRLGKTSIQDISKDEIRKKISVATQFHYIFQDTLKQNLAIARPGASDREIENALARAGLEDFMKGLPHGIHEVMPSRGMGLSGGEKQRICLARLFLRKAPILILDEPWSSLDRGNREILIQIINRCRTDTTVLVLSHEKPDKLEADQVYGLTPVSTSRVST
ncbi:ABC transporter ATP-binding protein [Desulfospira joergensenii]|uniref:ABC transporter ATP-binding protein n=1 Tax=Desulfospira joergensenii TaxID=53329 RepID=UPI0003B62720|nr:ABC transporter ATP-binding protein [Desulfospira joergensenii]